MMVTAGSCFVTQARCFYLPWSVDTQPTKQVGPQDMTHVQYIQPIIDVAGSSLSSNFQYLTETW